MKARARLQFAVALLTFLISSCGGGGGSSPASTGGTGTGGTGTGGTGTGGTPPAGPSISYSTTSFHFQADKPYSPTPASGSIVATVTGVTSGTLYITVIENNPDVVTVQNITVTSMTSGQATVVPARPGYLMAGNHQGSFVVRACLNDPTCNTGQLNGSPQTFTVEYDIGSNIDADTVTPRVVAANVAGTFTLRGHGFAIGQTVSIGSAATVTSGSISYYSESDLGVNYPPLPAGTYPITVNAGSVNYHSTLSVVDPPGFTATLLPYPSVSPTQIVSLEYDEDRKALLVLVNTATDPVLLRYAFDGTNWSAPTQVSIPGLQQIHLSPDGTKILGLMLMIPSQQAGFIELDPTTLSQTASIPLPASVATILPTGLPGAWFALANDGNAVVVMYAAVPVEPVVSTVLSELVYGTSSHVYSAIPVGSVPIPVAAVASGNGNLVDFGYEYNASGGSLDGSIPNLTPGGPGASFDLAGDKLFQPFVPSLGSLILNPQVGGVIGRLPDTLVGVLNRAGTRLYNIENADLTPHLHIFDTSTSNGPNSNYTELTPALSLAGDPGVTSQMTPLAAISADGTIVFIAGANGLLIQPVPH